MIDVDMMLPKKVRAGMVKLQPLYRINVAKFGDAFYQL